MVSRVGIEHNPQIKSWIAASKTFQIRMILCAACAPRAIPKRIDATAAQPLRPQISAELA
jgi:hypothetical protein